jgi:hypothetical protein
MVTRQDTGNIEEFWHHVLGGGRGLLQIWTGKRGSDGEIDRASIKSNFFAYPKAATAAATWALEKSAEGREVYFCCHLLTEARRVKENAAEVHALWGDLDGAPIPNGELKPTAVVESSPGRFHPYWRLTDPIPPETAEQLNKRLAHKIGADPSGFDRTQLLRVPGTHNHKYEERPVVELENLDEHRTYSAGDLDRLLPPLPRAERDSANGQGSGAGEPDEDVGPASLPPPVALGSGALAVWRGQRPKRKPDGSVDRSTSIFEVARVLVRAGLHPNWLSPVLAERDTTLGWNTYAQRPEEYRRIAHKLLGDVPPGGTSYTHGNGRNDRESSLVRPVSLSGRAAPEPQGWHVAGLVPEGFTTTVYGPGGVAKSLVVLHLLMSAAFAGVDYWHGRKVGTCPVLLLDFEMDERTQLSRAKRIAAGAGWPDVPRGFEYVPAVGHAPADVFAYAVEWLEGLDTGLVGIDSYGFAMAGDAVNSADVLRFHREYVAPIHAAGGSTVAVDHIPRPQRGERAADKDPFGSVYKTNAARSVINAAGHQDGPGAVFLTLAHRKINVGPKCDPLGLRVVFDGAEGPITFERADPEEAPAPPPTAADLLLAAFEKHGRMTATQAAELAGVSHKTAQNAATSLKADGELRETGEKRGRELVLEAAPS